MSSMSKQQVAALPRVTRAVMNSSLIGLKMASQTRQKLEARLAALDAERRRMTPDVTQEVTRAGADLLWHRWAEAQRAELNIALARARAEQAEAWRASATAFGRDRALRKALARAAERKG